LLLSPLQIRFYPFRHFEHQEGIAPLPDGKRLLVRNGVEVFVHQRMCALRIFFPTNRGLDATIGFDYSPDDVARENVQIRAGARFNAPFTRRPKDRLAVGFVYSKISDSFSAFDALLGGAPLGSEKAFELNYAIQVTPYWLVQPTFQYYIQVDGNHSIPDAPVFGFRTKVNF
jgi:hypothetical protein